MSHLSSYTNYQASSPRVNLVFQQILCPASFPTNPKSRWANPPPAQLDFKWADNCIVAGDWTDFTLNGDAAPNDRFNYRALLKP